MSAAEASVVGRVGMRLGLTEGQVYTTGIAMVVGVWAAIAGIPPTLVDRIVRDAGRPAAVAPIGADQAPALPGPATTVPPVDAGGGFGLPLLPSGAGAGAGFGGDGSFFEGGIGGGGGETTGGDTGPRQPARPFGTMSVFAPVPPPGAPEGIVVARDGRVVVATNSATGTPVVLRYTDEGAVETTTALAGVEPGFGVRGLASPDGSADVVYAVTARPAAVLRVDLVTGTASTYAPVPDLPACVAVALAGPCELSPVDNPPAPRAAAFGADGTLYVADAGQAVVWRVRPSGGQAELFHQAVEYVSTDGLSGVAVDGAGRLVLTVAAAPTQAQGGVVYRLADGALTEVATVPAGERPTGVAVDSLSGRLYVALAGAGRLLVLDDAGAEVARFPKPEDTALDTPVGVALRGTEALVTEKAPSRPLGGRVVSIAIAD